MQISILGQRNPRFAATAANATPNVQATIGAIAQDDPDRARPNPGWASSELVRDQTSDSTVDIATVADPMLEDILDRAPADAQRLADAVSIGGRPSGC